MLWWQWWNIQCSVYIVCLSNQSVNCIYFSLTRSSFKLKTEQRLRLEISVQSGVPKFWSHFFIFIFLTIAALHCLFVKGKAPYCFEKTHFSFFFSHSCSALLLYTRISHMIRFFIIATHFQNHSVNCSLSLWWFSIDQTISTNPTMYIYKLLHEFEVC